MGSVPSSPLFSHYLSPPSSSSSLFVPGTISCSFGGRQCCALAWCHHCMSLMCPHWTCAFAQHPTLDTVTNNEHHRSPLVGAGFLSYFHHVVLGLDEVDCHSPRCHRRAWHTCSHKPFPFSSHDLDINLSGVCHLIQLPSVLVCHSLCWMLSAHGTRGPALLHPQNLPCACDGVSHESCVSLGAMPCEASSLGTHTLSAVRLNLVSDFLCHILYAQC